MQYQKLRGRLGWILLVIPIWAVFYHIEEWTPLLGMLGYFLFGLAGLIWMSVVQDREEEK
ncbi:hypothetical protein [Ammoniphilus sp. CFH 90114]|uniref:hypothetical protein n=1 Tax=Ammoniphilus sp. CFH 90114 TaxID=2493665 RepID=UPI00100DEEA1|nr:hypothetical protein [Ammoniphilus sp. CFH 90114]RXT04008.1 hypothetical protein EIZ39_21860 [Ammoniphilus sp. CFH 90114]